jgi:hypothetical protein
MIIVTLEVESVNSITNIKTKIQDKEGILVVHQRMIFSSQPLEDICIMVDYDI